MEIKTTNTKTIVLSDKSEIDAFNSIVDKVRKLSKQIGYRKELQLTNDEQKIIDDLKA